MTSVTLTDDELILLDGRCSEEVQAKVGSAKDRIAMRSVLPDVSPEVAGFVSDAVNEALKNGKLIYRHTRLMSCEICKKSAGYAVYKRSGRYHRKGEKDHSKPLYLSGVELADRVVVMTGYATLGCCQDCMKEVVPVLAKALIGIKAQLPDVLKLDGAPTYKKMDNMKCKCGWTGHEGEMGKLPTLLGDGYYPGKCPACGAENRFLCSEIKKSEGFTLVQQ